MAPRSISVLKFVGTVSLGLLTGLSYTLSTLTVPTLLTLPSASTASRAFKSLASTAETQLRTLTSLSGSAFLLAYLLSPRQYRHPYLLYTSILVLSSRLVTSELVAPYLYLNPRAAQSGTASTTTAGGKQRRDRARTRMEASYEVLGSTGSDAHSDGTGSASGEEVETEEQQNGEEVRLEVEDFLKKQMVQTAVTGLGFLIAVVGIWGDGVTAVCSKNIIVGA